MAEFVPAVICGILAIVCAVISILSFKEKGILFNNAYIWASKQERNTMDKRPHYRQSAIIFALCAALFFCMAIECAFQTKWLWLLVFGFAAAALIYAIASSVKQQTKP